MKFHNVILSIENALKTEHNKKNLHALVYLLDKLKHAEKIFKKSTCGIKLDESEAVYKVLERFLLKIIDKPVFLPTIKFIDQLTTELTQVEKELKCKTTNPLHIEELMAFTCKLAQPIPNITPLNNLKKETDYWEELKKAHHFIDLFGLPANFKLTAQRQPQIKNKHHNEAPSKIKKLT